MTKNKRKVIALVMAMAMVMVSMFAMTTSVFAGTDDTITVTVKFDTRSYDLHAAMKTVDNNLVSNSPVVAYEKVTVPKGSSALDAVEKVASEHGFAVETKSFGDANVAITDIGKVGEHYLTTAQMENSFIRLGIGENAYNVSGWVYGITPENSTEYFPYDYMNAYTLSDGMVISMHYSVTGPYDYNTSNWTVDYSNPDVDMWNLYDQLTDKIATATDPDAAMMAEFYQSTVADEIAAAANDAGNTTGLTAYYFSHTGITNDGQATSLLQEALSFFE